MCQAYHAVQRETGVYISTLCICSFTDQFKLAVYKSGMGTRERGHQDACVGTWDVGTWDLGTRDEGLEDIKYGMRGRVGQGRRGRGM